MRFSRNWRRPGCPSGRGARLLCNWGGGESQPRLRRGRILGPVRAEKVMGEAAEQNIVIECPDVSYRVDGERRLLSNLDCQVHSGETVVVLCRSGTGKTPTLKLINRLLAPTSGEVIVDGRRTVELDPIRLRRRIGSVIQEVGLFPHFTVARNVGLVPSLE